MTAGRNQCAVGDAMRRTASDMHSEKSSSTHSKDLGGDSTVGAAATSWPSSPKKLKAKKVMHDSQRSRRIVGSYIKERLTLLQRKEFQAQALSRSSSGSRGGANNVNHFGGWKQGSPKEEEKRPETQYPVRPGLPDCQYYLKTGKCTFGARCKFNHPERDER